MQISQEQADQFAQAVLRERDAMFRLARGVLRNDWDAQDSVSETIERAWAGLPQLRDWGRMRPWLLRICYRCCLQAQKHRAREQALDPVDVERLAGSSPEETPLWVYLELLPQKGRLVMLLRYQEGLPIDEIARVLGLPRGTVSARLSRATKQLREIILKEEAGHG